jgi:phage terminase large subunit-like protein
MHGYAAPADADPWSEDTWHACNPALGDFRSLEEMRVAADQAQRLPAREASFRLLYLNQPIDAASRFLNRADWDICKSYPQELAGQRCYIGLDLSSTTDLTALAAYFPDTGNLLCWFWSPADTLAEAERRDHVPYLTWARTGHLETTPGRAIDKSFVVHRLGKIANEYKVEACAFDRWGMAEFQRLMADEDLKLNMVEFGQGWKDMAPALNAVETLVLQRELRHPDHPILNWCVANAVAVSDPAGNRKLAKDRSIGRIDGLVAAVMAIGLATRTPKKKPSVYATRGLLTVSAPS